MTGARATRGLLVAIAAAVAVAAGVAAAFLLRSPEPPALRAGTALPEPRSIEAIALVDSGGGTFDRSRFEGRWTVLFTGFTHCPDVCPMTLALLASLRDRLPDERLQFVFLSVDPERDTPEAVARYIAHFGDGLVGATGDPAHIERFTRQLGLAHLVNPGAGDDYTVDHSTALVLIDPKARLAGFFTAPHDADAIAADLAGLAGDAARRK